MVMSKDIPVLKLYLCFTAAQHGGAHCVVAANLVWVEVFAWWVDNLSHEGRVLDVLIVAEHMHSILPRLCGPVAYVTGPVTLVVTFNLGLRWTFHRKTWTGFFF